MRELFKASSLIGFQKLITVALGLVRIKVSAVFLQVSGVGIVSQVVSLKNLLQQFVSLGVGGGITKYVAEYTSGGDRERLQTLLRTVTTGFALTGLALLLGSILFAPQLAELVLADRSLGLLVVLAGVAVPLTAQYEVITRCLQGALHIREMVMLAILSSVVGVLILIPLVIVLDVFGAVLAIALGAAASVAIGHLYLRATILRPLDITLNADWPDLQVSKDLLRFGGARGATVLSTVATLLIIRAALIRDLGPEANGLYQVAWGMSNQYLGIVSGAIWGYGMPKIATMLDDPRGIRKLQNNALRLSLLILVPAVTLLLVLREIWIPLLYAPSFLAAYGLVSAQLLGDLFLAVRWAPNLTNVPRERFAFIIGQAVAQSAIQLAAFFALLPRIGVLAAPASYAISHGAMVPPTLLGHYLYDRFRFDRGNWLLLIGSAPVVGVAAWATAVRDRPLWLFAGAPLSALLLWALVMVRRSELRAGLEMVRRAFRRQAGTGQRLDRAEPADSSSTISNHGRPEDHAE
jgi:O-antigen/teichoic acid export membrane protein